MVNDSTRQLLMHTLMETLQRDWPVSRWADTPQLLAVSGGADSVALLRAITELTPSRDRIYVAHFNHGWRGEESDADEKFVRELCCSLSLHLEVGRSQVANVLPVFSDGTMAVPNSSSVAGFSKRQFQAIAKTEEAARKARYQFLNRVAADLRIRYVLTAHTASDRIETMLHNLCRGTGLAGVCSPTLTRVMRSGITLVRPLIGCFRWQVEQYLESLKQPFRTDASNSDQAYRRNFLRASVLPMLREAYGVHVDQRLLSFSQIAEETLQSVQQQAQSYWQQAKTLSLNPNEIKRMKARSRSAIVVPSAHLLPAAWIVVQFAVVEQWRGRGWPQQSLSRRHWELIRRFWELGSSGNQTTACQVREKASKPCVILPGQIRMEYRKGWIILEPTT